MGHIFRSSFHDLSLVSLLFFIIIPIYIWIPWISGNISTTPVDGVSSCNRSRIYITNSTWGIVTDGPTNYTQNSHCEWLIEAPDDGDLITLMIHNLRTECSYDYLFIFDGKSYRHSKLLASLSGATKPLIPFVAKSGFMLLLMYSDTNYALEGFIGEYFISPCPLQCSNWTTACTGDSKCICESGGQGHGQTCPKESFSNSTPAMSRNLQRIGHSAIRLDNLVYIYGGFDLNVIRNDLIIMDLNSEPEAEILTLTSFKSGNEVRSDQQDQSWPVGRYGHASIQFKTGFFVQGGRTEKDGISNEFLYFETIQKKWTKYKISGNGKGIAFPRLIYHTMTMTRDHIVYVYGGGTPSGAFSSTLYKFHAEIPEKWEIVDTFCCGKTKDRSLLAHTMNYYPDRHALLIFGGLVSDLGRFSKLSSQLWMFLIDTQVWLPLDYRKPQIPAPGPGGTPPLKIIERAFHSTVSIGNHLVMIGGYTHAHNRDEICYAQHILLYNIDCHVLVSEDVLANEGVGVFGHQSIFWKTEKVQEVLVIGGYRGYLNTLIGRIPLSLSGAGPGSRCSTYIKRWRCSGDPLCGWCPTDEKCYEKISGSKNCTTNLQTSQCPGICPTLKTCQACVLSGGCSWCDTTDSCIKSPDESGALCQARYLRSSLTSCSGSNERQEITLAEYRQPVDLNQPDSVRFLNATAFILPRDAIRGEDGVTTMFIMKGVLKDASSPMNRMELCALQSYVQLTMTMPHPSESLSVFIRWSDSQSCVNLSWASGLPVSLMPGTRITFELTANSTTTTSPLSPGTGGGGGTSSSSQKIPPEKFGHVSLRHNSKIFRKENLQLFSSEGQSCHSYQSCLLCLTDGSCSWRVKENHQYGGSCLGNEETLKALNTTFVMTPFECALCHDFTTCSECLKRKDCEWSEEEAGCSRKGRTPPALLLNVEDPASCSPDCHLRKNCSTCLDIAGACVWCSQTQECFAFSVYTSFYQYGQCYSWKDKGSQCQECVKQSNCDDCILHLGCGWNYNESGGSCTEGDFKGPYVNDDENSTALELHYIHIHGSYDGNETEKKDWTWTYDACPDIDECTLGLDECHENATCVNTPGSYICQCHQGFTGDGKTSCDQTCFDPCVHGTCSPEFICECELGWTGIDCSIDCGCNNHSTCEVNGPGQGCDRCQDFTEGENCEKCISGSYGNATLGNIGCRECECNWNGDPKLGFCDNIDGRCFCLKHTTGMHCNRCEAGYFGNPEIGESCYKDCHGRAVLDSSYGFFGVDPVRGDSNPQHCLWIINAAAKSTSSSSGKSRREVTTSGGGGGGNTKSNSIRITISSNFQIPCAENSLRIYSGLPSFSRPTKNAQLLASICSYEGEKMGQSEIVVDVEGVFATVVLQYAHGSLQKALFNASFQKISTTGGGGAAAGMAKPEVMNLEALPIEIEKLSDGQSVLPRFGHTLHADERNVWIFGGYSFSHGFLNDIRQFRRDVNQWIPLTITVVQNEDSVPLGRYFHAGVLGPNSEIFIHGGIAGNLSFLSDTWRFDTRLSRWKRLSKERRVLQLAGHSLTIRGTTEDQCQLVLVGGISPIDGFSSKVFYFPCSGGNWEETNTTGSSPVGIYGHSSVYHRFSDTFYIFGGVIYERDKVLVSPNLYALHWPSRRWTLLPPNPENQILPLPSARFFHSAVTTESYMIVLGGAGSPKNFSLLGYVYQCNLWVLIGSGDGGKGEGQEIHRSGGGASVAKDDLLVMGGWDGVTSKESLIRLSLPKDICSIQIPEGKCKGTLGCSYCSSNNNHTRQCYNSSLDMPKECSSGASNIVFWKGQLCSHQWMEGRNCSHYTTCSDCLASWPAHPNLKQACQWCTNCQVGKCIPVSKKCQGEASCGMKQRETIDSSHCPERLCSASECEKCTASGKCIWTRQILKSSFTSFTVTSQPLYDWNCVRKSILDTSPSFTVSSSPPDKCPAPCVDYLTCEDCLNAPGSDGGFQECHWSLSLNRCVSPAHKNLVCFGGICGSVLRGTPSICPKPCSSHKSCSSCLEFPNCGWCADEGKNGEGRCLQGDYFSPATTDESSGSGSGTTLEKTCSASNWNYLTCPAENECINNHHTCNDASENCIDLNVGFQCVCREGYEKSKDSCVPICHQGCINGNCVTPDKCECHFGFVGTNCSSQCNCNGHSHCASEKELDICLDCKNNTMGTHCSRCKHFFVGDPKNGGTCIPCGEYCNGHSEVCLSLESYEKFSHGHNFTGDSSMETQIKTSGLSDEGEPGPLNRAFCISCKHETSGEKCDDCISGYFRGSEDKRLPCRKCECHGHGDRCDAVTGLECNCANNTESDHCTQGSKQTGQQCWKLQCAKCREYYLGIPTNGHHCYRQMHVDTDYCFDPKTQESCTVNPKPLLSGRTVFFAVQPKFMNVNIRINLDVTHGAVHAYLSPKEDTFVIRQDSNTWMHLVEFDTKYNIGGAMDGQISEEHFSETNLTESSVITKPILNDYFELRELEAAGFATHVKVEEPRAVLLVRNLRNRLVITLPQEDHDLRLTRFYIVLEGIGDVSYGSIFFRQDQLHIDLFVFFSVFFSAFFLFLAACGIAWKFKQNLETRRARHRHAEQMLSMAKRPFAVWTLILEPDPSSSLHRVYSQCRKSCRKGCICLRPVAVEPTREGSSAVCTMFVSLPGAPTAPVRLALGSGLSNVPTHHTNIRRRRL